MNRAVLAFQQLCCADERFRNGIVLVGMAAYWALWREPFLGTVYRSDLPGMFGARLWFYVLLFALGAIVLLCMPTLSKIRPWFSLVSAGIVSVGALTVALSSAAPGVEIALQLVGGAGLVVGMVGLSVTWGTFLLSISRQSASVCLFGSFALSFLFGFLDLVPGALFVLMPVMPLVSGAALLAAWTETVADHIDEGASSEEDEASATRFLVVCITVCAVAGFLASTMRSLWLYDAGGYSPALASLVTYVESICIAGAFFVARVKLDDFLSALLADLAITLAVLLVGLLTCSFVALSAGLGLVSTAHTALQFLFWVAMAHLAQSRGVRAMGVFFVVESAVSLVTMYLVPQLVDISFDKSASFAFPLALGGSALVAIAGAVLAAGLVARLVGSSAAMRGRAVALSGGEVPVVQAFFRRETRGESLGAKAVENGIERSGDLATVLSERYGLTEREAQVADSLARGNSMKRAADELFLAPSTVQSYTKVIYRKMGIHRKQELIDIVASLGQGRE